ncbi:MAG: hypothetical protein P0Y55_01150 [Candidatus Cohnella colombiensis]|uniref:Uncharacterized protein n=1 Tax=Candidatus Cohnella colombiensis TaxID=3121368 RepID=A0AA95JGA2_9BACL|nr:MAG: hypothetical protein P0Y55_01150 [Cohnella sp.]
MSMMEYLQTPRLHIQSKLHQLGHTHLYVKQEEQYLYIYSLEEQEATHRVQLIWFTGDVYMLSVADHRGQWQQIPFIGDLEQTLALVTGKLAFSLARWPERGKACFND